MGNGIINESYLNDIAIAIQSKTGSSSTMTPSEMAGQIDSIHTAGDVVLGSGSFSANGTYSAAGDNLDGYDTVTVTVPLSSITISANGSYSAAQGGYNNISVEVPQVSLSTLNVSVNDTYTAPSGTAYDEVVVNVPSAVLSSKTISANGTYNAIDDSLDGYSSIVVNVSGGSTPLGNSLLPTTKDVFIWDEGYIDSNGVIQRTEGYYHTKNFLPYESGLYFLDKIGDDTTSNVWSTISLYDNNKEFIGYVASALSSSLINKQYSLFFILNNNNAAYMKVNVSGNGGIVFNKTDELNLIDWTDDTNWTKNYYLDPSSNYEPVAYNDYFISDYINIENKERITFNLNTDDSMTYKYYCLYDSSKNVISGGNVHNANYIYIDIPSNAKFLRISGNNPVGDYQIVADTTIIYQRPYGI